MMMDIRRILTLLCLRLGLAMDTMHSLGNSDPLHAQSFREMSSKALLPHLGLSPPQALTSLAPHLIEHHVLTL